MYIMSCGSELDRRWDARRTNCNCLQNMFHLELSPSTADSMIKV